MESTSAELFVIALCSWWSVAYPNKLSVRSWPHIARLDWLTQPSVSHATAAIRFSILHPANADPLLPLVTVRYPATNFAGLVSPTDTLPLLASVPFTPPFTLKPRASLVS